MTAQNRATAHLEAFKGIEKRYNFAIFTVLSISGPLPPQKIHSQVKKQPGCDGIREGSLYKRLHSLVLSGYLNERPPNEGSRAKRYELSDKALLALIFREVAPQELIDQADDIEAKFLMAIILKILSKNKSSS